MALVPILAAAKDTLFVQVAFIKGVEFDPADGAAVKVVPSVLDQT